jgi:hypothetical protein
MCNDFSSPKTKFLHTYLSLVPFCQATVSPTKSYSVKLTSGISLFVPSGSLSEILRGNLLNGILLTCPNHRNHFPPLTSNIPSLISASARSFATLSIIQIVQGKVIYDPYVVRFAS